MFMGGAVVSSYLAQSVAILGDVLITLKYFAVACPQPWLHNGARFVDDL